MTGSKSLLSLLVVLPILFIGIFLGINYKFKFVTSNCVIVSTSVGLALFGVVIGLLAYFLSDSSSSDGPSQYMLSKSWTGSELRPESNKGWVYYNQVDPTHGIVQYGPYPELMTDAGGGKIKISVGNEVVPTAYGNGRKSIRINTSEFYNQGMFIMKVDHIPEGPGIWPSWWLNGENAIWACHGEIDIIEGAGSLDRGNPNDSVNSTTLHTSTPAGLQPCDQTGVPGIKNPQCSLATSGYTCGCSGKEGCPDLGCGVQQWQNSFGPGFNARGGGVYACELTSSGLVRVWFFPAGSIPSDIENNNIQPDTWSKQNYIEFKPCPGQFKEMSMIIDTTICGDWFGSPENINRCVNMFNNPQLDLSNAYWLIEYIKVFQAK